MRLSPSSNAAGTQFRPGSCAPRGHLSARSQRCLRRPISLDSRTGACALPSLPFSALIRLIHAPLPHATPAAALRSANVGEDCPPLRLGPPRPRPWRPAVHRPARPLRHDPDGCRPGFARLSRSPRAVRAEWVIRVDGTVRPRPAGTGNADLPTGAGRGLRDRHRGAVRGRRTAAAGLRRPRLSRGDAAQVPLPRPAPRQAPPEHHEAVGRSSTRSAGA